MAGAPKASSILKAGCYAKAINLSEVNEPEIFAAARQPGAIMENVILDENGVPDYDDDSLTENTRIAYPLTAIANRVDTGMAPTPKHVVLLAADAFGVLPPLAKLSPEQAIYYFLSGYTAKLAGTERGVTEPEADVLGLFRRAFPGPVPRRLRQDARHASRRVGCHLLAFEHRLVGRRSGCWQAHVASGDPQAVV